jgi:HEAT repeat protein
LWLVEREGYERTMHLGLAGAEQAMESLLAALRDENSYVRGKAAQALAKIGQPALEPLMADLGNEVPEVRRRVEWTLEQIDTPEARAAVAEAKGERERKEDT